jgi:Na+/proline symporter
VHWINWVIIIGWLAYVAIDGLRRARGTTEIRGYFLANRSLPWWAVGLSVMATQLSAVTMIGTTGQGATDGLRFVQFYFGLPLAMVILGVTLVPFLHGANVFTAYEYLEKRFDAKTRSLTAFLFLLSRAACRAGPSSARRPWSSPPSSAGRSGGRWRSWACRPCCTR